MYDAPVGVNMLVLTMCTRKFVENVRFINNVRVVASGAV